LLKTSLFRLQSIFSVVLHSFEQQYLPIESSSSQSIVRYFFDSTVTLAFGQSSFLPPHHKVFSGLFVSLVALFASFPLFANFSTAFISLIPFSIARSTPTVSFS
jgi:hypothetical protein